MRLFPGMHAHNKVRETCTGKHLHNKLLLIDLVRGKDFFLFVLALKSTLSLQTTCKHLLLSFIHHLSAPTTLLPKPCFWHSQLSLESCQPSAHESKENQNNEKHSQVAVKIHQLLLLKDCFSLVRLVVRALPLPNNSQEITNTHGPDTVQKTCASKSGSDLLQTSQTDKQSCQYPLIGEAHLPHS